MIFEQLDKDNIYKLIQAPTSFQVDFIARMTNSSLDEDEEHYFMREICN